VIVEGWEWVKAQDVMDIRDGTHDSPQYQSSGIPLVTSKNLVDGQIDFSTCSLISQNDHELISKRSAVCDGDILYAMIGTIGNPVIVKKEYDFSIKNVALFKFNSDRAFNKYIYHFLNTDIAKRQFEKNSRGGTQKFVSLGNIRNLKIPLPPLEEQKRIAAVLDKADTLRRKRERAITLTDDLLRSVFLDMFGDPVTNPKGWEMKKFAKFADLINGDRSKNYPSGKDIVKNGVLFLNTKNIINNQLDLSETSYITEEKFHSLTQGALKRNDIVITLRGSLGSSCVFDSAFETGFINAQMMIIRVKSEQISEKYVHSVLTFPTFKKMLKEMGSGSAVPQLTASQIKELEIPIPSSDLWNHYKEVEQKIRQRTKSLVNQKNVIDSLFSSLTQRAFRGELTAQKEAV
jgi:type I restriction enzyme, S subunit